MSRPWIFRVASTPEVGGGHVARCLSIATALQSDYPCVFVLDEGSDDWVGRIEAAGFIACIIGHEGCDPWSGCLLDGYNFTETDAAYWKRKAEILVVMDDFGAPPNCADLAIAPAHEMDLDREFGVRRIGGPDHAVVDSRYSTVEISPGGTEVGKILIGFGYRDSANATGIAIEALSLLAADDFEPEITVCLGSGAPHLVDVKNLILSTELNITCLVDQPGMHHLLAETDLVIGGGGVSLLERMAAGRPSISIAVAENQRPQIEWAAALSATLDGGDAKTVQASQVAATVVRIAGDVTARREMSSIGRTTIDGRGAERIAGEISALFSSQMI